MDIKSIVNSLNLTAHNTPEYEDTEVNGGYCSDLLSDVIANANEDHLWITMQVHKNIVAVAAIKRLAGIILVNSRKPDQKTIDKATEENIPLFTSDLTAYEVAGRLYNMGLHGKSSDKE